MLMPPRQTGFTIVELLIVVVVIAILAAISVIAYSGIQIRARDAMRADSIAKIVRALEMYKTDNGKYPVATANPGSGGYEQSTDVDGSFMEYLKPYGFSSGVPLDPINDANHYYRYHRYAAGHSGCDPDKGAFITLEVMRFESLSNMPTSEPTLTCPLRSWYGSGARYFMYRFENE